MKRIPGGSLVVVAAFVAALLGLPRHAAHAGEKTAYYTLTIIPPVNGTLAASPAMPAGGYPMGTVVTLSAVANPGYMFSAWTGANGAEVQPSVLPVLGSGTLAMSGNKTVGAAFVSTDATPPTGTVIINENRSATKSAHVTLTLTWSDGDGSGVSRMRFSDDGATWTPWEPLAATRAHTLPAGDGHKTVRVQYLDRANNRSTTCSDYIRLDTTPPAGAILINSGDSVTLSRAVTLGLTWSDGAGAGVTRMRFSDNGSNWTAWEAPKAVRPHTLPAGTGYRTVRVQFLDGAGNYSLVHSDYIKLAEPAPGEIETVMLPDNVPLELVWVPAGTFLMGRAPGELDSYAFEAPQHTVTLTAGYWIGKYELTQAQWKAVMGGANPSYFQGGSFGNTDNHPVDQVSWNDAQAFITALNAHITASGRGAATLRLPTEAEWEHACRAGTTTRFHWGEDTDYTQIGTYAWWVGNSGSQTHDVGTAGGTGHPNAFGLCDMNGNVWEWCQDWYYGDYTGAPTDGSAWESPAGTERVGRGGGWDNRKGCRSASRTYAAPTIALYNVGFRLARP